MANINSKLVSFIALFLMLANKLVHSQVVTSFTYDTFSPTTQGLTYQGKTHVPSGYTFLRLTQVDSSDFPKTYSVGRVLFSRPVKFWDYSSGNARQASFETRIDFVITPSTFGRADGLVFFIAPVNTTIIYGSEGGSLGIFCGRCPSVFAVEFDTHINTWDPPYRHIGIDIEPRISKNYTSFDSGTGELVRARINYDATTNYITVVARSGNQTASLSYVFDLKTILPEQVQVGISSSTGEPSYRQGVHNVMYWTFTSSLVYTYADVDEEAYIPQYIGTE